MKKVVFLFLWRHFIRKMSDYCFWEYRRRVSTHCKKEWSTKKMTKWFWRNLNKPFHPRSTLYHPPFVNTSCRGYLEPRKLLHKSELLFVRMNISPKRLDYTTLFFLKKKKLRNIFIWKKKSILKFPNIFKHILKRCNEIENN